MDKEIKQYLEKQPSPQNEILKKVRNIFLKALPDCEEKKAWGVITFSDNKFYIVALKEGVNIGFAIKGLDKEEISQFEGSGKTMKSLKIKSLKDIDESKLIKLIKLVDKKAVGSCGQKK
jgi:hypothetical protein